MHGFRYARYAAACPWIAQLFAVVELCSCGTITERTMECDAEDLGRHQCIRQLQLPSHSLQVQQLPARLLIVNFSVFDDDNTYQGRQLHTQTKNSNTRHSR